MNPRSGRSGGCCFCRENRHGLWDDMHCDIMFIVVTSIPATGRRCADMDVVLTFLATVVAGIVAGVAVHIICKWLDNSHRDR